MNHGESAIGLAAIGVKVPCRLKERPGPIELPPSHRQRPQTKVGISPIRQKRNGSMVIIFGILIIIQGCVTIGKLRKDLIVRIVGFRVGFTSMVCIFIPAVGSAKWALAERDGSFQMSNRLFEPAHFIQQRPSPPQSIPVTWLAEEASLDTSQFLLACTGLCRTRIERATGCL